MSKTPRGQYETNAMLVLHASATTQQTGWHLAIHLGDDFTMSSAFEQDDADDLREAASVPATFVALASNLTGSWWTSRSSGEKTLLRLACE